MHAKRYCHFLGWILAALLTGPLAAELVVEDIDALQTKGIDVPRPEGSPEIDKPRLDVLHFLNGDRLHGKLLAIRGEDGLLTWKHEGVLQPIVFFTADISRVELSRQLEKSLVALVEEDCRVELTSGGVLYGDFIQLGEEQLLLHTPYAGPLSLLRSMVRSLMPLAQGHSPVYSGPSGLEEWIDGSGAARGWSYSEGALLAHANTPLGRDMNLPTMSKISFEAEWLGRLALNLHVYKSQVNNHHQGFGYLLSINDSQINLYRNMGGNNSVVGQRVQMPDDLQQQTKMAFELRCDLDRNLFHLILNGRTVCQWQDQPDFHASGRGLIFHPQHQHPWLAIRNIRVESWDGLLLAESTAPQDEQEDAILFANNDRISGTLKQIDNDLVSFKNDFSALDIPLKRISRIDMATARQSLARRNRGDVLALFNGEGRIAFDLIDLKGDVVTGHSENFGDAKFDLSAFKTLQFHLYSNEP